MHVRCWRCYWFVKCYGQVDVYWKDFLTMGWSCPILCLACHSDLLIRELQASFESRVIQKSWMLNKGHSVAQLVEALRYKALGGAVGRGTALQGTRWRSWSRHWATSRKVAVSIIRWCHGHGLEVDLASNRKEYKEYFLGGKGVGLTTLPPSCADCQEIWEPQPPGTLGSYKETVLPRS